MKNKLGIIGGGQLAKMTAQAAAQLGCEVVVLERQAEFPAGSVAARTVIGDWDKPESLLELASLSDVITLENEFVDHGALAVLEQRGHKLLPPAATMRRIQDKFIQKQTLAAAGLPVPRFADAPNPTAITAAAAQFGWPLVLKRRKLGYDGKGNATLRGPADIQAAWQRLEGDRHPLYVEEFCPFTMELAVIVTRGQDGATVLYPVTETINRNHICHVTKTPAPVPAAAAARAAELARRTAEVIGIVGSMGLELFLRDDGAVLINEIAPRVHNTGHYTIEACACSQFENHVRAVLGWPLGSPAMRAPAAVMVNLLGSADGPGTPQGLADALRVAGAHIHIYGKTRSAKGRKMGHVTALGATLDEALATAQRAADCIRFGTAQQ
jgi:5-(carboxyamino)imidazole ribonucleotide synthase